MNAKLFYTLNLFAYMGIGACNGVNSNMMEEDKKSKDELKNESGSSSGYSSLRASGSNVSSEEQNALLRRMCVDILSDKVHEQFGAYLPEVYKKFLIENDPDTLKNIGKELDPFSIVSFRTPDGQSNDKMSKIVDQMMLSQRGFLSSLKTVMSIEEEQIKELGESAEVSSVSQLGIDVNKLWCVAIKYIVADYRNPQGGAIHYYIDLADNKQVYEVYEVVINSQSDSFSRRPYSFSEFSTISQLMSDCKKEAKKIAKIEDKKTERGSAI